MTTERETPNLPNSQKENVMNDLEKNICAQANIGTAIISEIKGNKSTMSGMCFHHHFVVLTRQEFRHFWLLLLRACSKFCYL